MQNKNSRYVKSLVDFINDTKPYHSKLAEIIEEYQFFDDMNVAISEKTNVRTKVNPTWLYNFFSSGSGGANTIGLKQLHSSLKNVDKIDGLGWQAIAPNDKDLEAIPYVYSKKAFSGDSIADVVIKYYGNSSTLPLVEGIDYFQSRGAFQFKVKQTSDANTNFVPSWVETRDEGNITQASVAARVFANDLANPNSGASKIRDLLVAIKSCVMTAPAPSGTPAQIAAENQARADALIEIESLLNGGVLNGTSVFYNGINNIAPNGAIQLPRDYEFLLNTLSPDMPTRPGTPVLVGYDGWLGNDGTPANSKYVSEELSANSTSLYFGVYADSDSWESGKAEYREVSNAFISIYHIHTDNSAVAGDTWEVISSSGTEPSFNVFSAYAGFVGSFTASLTPTVIVLGAITFTAELISQPVLGSSLKIQNRNRIVFGPDAPLETWDIIKTNPIAYSRPALNSTRYGYIVDGFGVAGNVSILGPSVLAGTIVLAALPGGMTFSLTSTSDPLYTATVPVNVPYNDGILAFTIIAGSVQPFTVGDVFYIAIKNDPVVAIGLDLGYGYDLDSYDADTLVYNNTDSLHPDYNRTLNFVFDTRFTDYDLNSLNLTLTQFAVSGRKWRIRAVPNLSKPIATLKKDGSGPDNAIDLQETTSGISPDVASTAAPLYSMLGDANPTPDLRVYYADIFSVEWSDDNFVTTTPIGSVSAGGTFTSSINGISFDLPVGTKPFIAVVSDDGLIDPAVQGGDVFTFGVYNEFPLITNAPIALFSGNSARLIPHGFGFHESVAAQWTVNVTSPTSYALSGINTEISPGSQVAGTPISGTFTTPNLGVYEGNSFNNFGVHFTISPGSAGLDVGDSFVFYTYTKKPSYLVHGSVSGWQAPATVGEAYWNGVIGFTIENPKVSLSDPLLAESIVTPSAENTWSVYGGTLSVTRLRFDAENTTYVLIPTPIGELATGWMISRDDVGPVGHLPLSGTFSDNILSIEAQNIDPTGMTSLQLRVIADDFDLWNAHDVVIVRPQIDTQLPGSLDSVFVDKRTSDSLSINLRYDSVGTPPSIAALAPSQINPTLIDIYTGPSGIPIEFTSPEAAILDNWIPLTMKSFDSTMSLAEFSDSATLFQVFSAGSGEQIGTLRTTANQLFPTEFEWDLDFYAAYLPLNAESNIVTFGSGFNDVVKARISESVRFLIGGGALSTDFSFTDSLDIQIGERHAWSIFQTYAETINPIIADGPFGGFLIGYDNEPYDSEVGGYDNGIPLTDNFIEAQQLAQLPGNTIPLTPAQLAMTPIERQLRLNALLGMLNGFLVGGDLASTTLDQFLVNVDAYVLTHPQTLASGFGIPTIGMGMDINIGRDGIDTSKPSTEGASAGIEDALVIIAVDTANTYDTLGVDGAGLDAEADRTALIYSGNLPPVPATLPVFTTYAEFETPLAVVGDPSLPSDFSARVFEINFRITPANQAAIQTMPTPKVFIWVEAAPAPTQVAIVTRVGAGKYQVSVPNSTEAKLYIQPGP